MSGVFGAGVFTGLKYANAYDKIGAIYGSSAGAFNAAFFLARQIEFGSTIYWENLTEGFIFPSRIPKGVAQRFFRGYLSQNGTKPVNIVDIDHLMSVAQREKRLNVEEICKQEIPFNVKVLDTQNGEIVYLNGKVNTLDALKSTVSVIPYYFAGNQRYIDADAVREPVGLPFLLEKHADEKIVLIINHKPNRGFRYALKNSLEGFVASPMYRNLPMFDYFNAKADKFRKEINQAREDERVLLIHPPEESPTKSNTTDPKKLIETWNMGRREAEKIVRFLG